MPEFDYLMHYFWCFILSIIMASLGFATGPFIEAVLRSRVGGEAEFLGGSVLSVGSLLIGLALFIVGLELGYDDASRKSRFVDETKFPPNQSMKYSKYPSLLAIVSGFVSLVYMILYLLNAYVNLVFILNVSHRYSMFTYQYQGDFDNLLRLFQDHPEYGLWFMYSLTLSMGGVMLLEQGIRFLRKGMKMRKYLSRFETVNVLIISIITILAGALPTVVFRGLPSRMGYEEFSFPPKWYNTDLVGTVPITDAIGFPAFLAGLIGVCSGILGLWVINCLSRAQSGVLSGSKAHLMIVGKDLRTSLEGLNFAVYVDVLVKNDGTSAGNATVYARVSHSGKDWQDNTLVHLNAGESKTVTFKFSKAEPWTTNNINYDVWLK